MRRGPGSAPRKNRSSMRRSEAATSAWGAANQTDVNDIYNACLSTNAIANTLISSQFHSLAS